MADYYIATTGDDTTGAGTEASPWATLTKANGSSANGDNIYMAAGTYTWTDAALGDMGSYRQYIGAVDSKGRPATVLDNGAVGLAYWNVGTLGYEVNISNIRFTNAVWSVVNDAIFELPTDPSSGYTIFDNCQFDNIKVYSTLQNGGLFTVKNNFDFNGRLARFKNCLFYEMSAESGDMYLFPARQNLIDEPNGIEFINCTFDLSTPSSGTEVAGIFARAYGLPHTTVIKNNIFYAVSSTTPIIADSSASVVTSDVDSNIYYGFSGFPSGTGDVNTQNVDPLFEDAANYNYNLKTGSPAAGAGVAI